MNKAGEFFAVNLFLLACALICAATLLAFGSLAMLVPGDGWASKAAWTAAGLLSLVSTWALIGRLHRAIQRRL